MLKEYFGWHLLSIMRVSKVQQVKVEVVFQQLM